MRGAFLIDVDRIRPDPQQPRREFDADQMEHLTASVRERGVRQPIRVWFVAGDDVYQIIAGERRYRAARAAGLKAIPCLVDEEPGGVAPDASTCCWKGSSRTGSGPTSSPSSWPTP